MSDAQLARCMQERAASGGDQAFRRVVDVAAAGGVRPSLTDLRGRCSQWPPPLLATDVHTTPASGSPPRQRWGLGYSTMKGRNGWKCYVVCFPILLMHVQPPPYACGAASCGRSAGAGAVRQPKDGVTRRTCGRVAASDTKEQVLARGCGFEFWARGNNSFPPPPAS